jgi:hypothetical protein
MFQEVAADPSALPGVVLSVQSYGESLNLHPYIRAIASRGIWAADGSFEAIPRWTLNNLLGFRVLRRMPPEKLWLECHFSN